ncbi:NAD(P)H-hydrate dehydratase [Pseudohoeflea coraliihabitans]|uniref:Bifunctional NAD(P)H-hydrate repair enzyme n=1 Tax=Pseudohoeflea coraliihabitans TaxID=2860393 RepID=A0ABS6WQI5_9HYPH|nr:NAD(P)H-hydrate dehydratase [Pseudohoeflea sp. DP4N28-3]MBW3098236.1 NAD(P)H-hydrate dehydratase [Pseudohoeflea sp. DP4N28-3]
MAVNHTDLFPPSAMQAIDAAAIANGLCGRGLMERAGAAVAAAALRHWPEMKRALVLCGPGNNGGDGHVAARHLSAAGVKVERFGLAAKAGSDAAWALGRFPGAVADLALCRPEAGDLVIDALFGAGLDRALEGDVAVLIERVNAAAVPVLAVDLPSGVSGRTGRPTGPCFTAERTVTFAAQKPGHVLLPGRALCGAVEVADIGFPARMLTAPAPVSINHPALYLPHLRGPDAAAHKYSRGHLVVFSGPLISGGAARMAAEAGLKAGAGLVSLATPPAAVMAQAAHVTAVMQRSIDGLETLEGWLDDRRLAAFILGPGFGADATSAARARAYAAAVASAGRRLVLDADGLSAFTGHGETLHAIGAAIPLVLTPHEGEFRRLFAPLAEDKTLSKIERAQAAAARGAAIVVYKGADTVIAAPDGRAAVNVDAPAWLATAGSGDVLAGLIGALLVQGMPAFEAACAGVAMHAAAARRHGPGLTAEDLIAAVRPLPLTAA